MQIVVTIALELPCYKDHKASPRVVAETLRHFGKGWQFAALRVEA